MVDSLAPYRVKRQFVFTIDDFLIHTLAHKTRVEFLVKRAYQKFHKRLDHQMSADEFKKHLYGFARIHDNGKVRGAEQLAKELEFKPDTVPIIEKLYVFYGINFAEMKRNDPVLHEKMIALRSQVVAELNANDASIGRAYLRHHHLVKKNDKLSRSARIIQIFEKVADGVDRGLSQVSPYEFARSMYKASKSFEVGSIEQEMAVFLEGIYYPEMIKHQLTFTLFKKRYLKARSKLSDDGARCNQLLVLKKMKIR